MPGVSAAPGNRPKASVFIASDGERGKQRVTAVAGSMGFDVVDADDLQIARELESGAVWMCI